MDGTAELDEFRETFRNVLRREWPIAEALLDGAAKERRVCELWSMVAELGWLGLHIPEEHGGLGLSFGVLAALYRELGAVLAPLPLLPTMLLAEAVQHGGTQAQRAAWLPRIASGEIKAAVPASSSDRPVRLEQTESGPVLTGEIDLLLEGEGASTALLRVVAQDGVLSFAIFDLTAKNFQLVRSAFVDSGRSLARLRLDGVRISSEQILATAPGPLIEAVLEAHALLAIASDAAGGCDAIFDVTLDYLRTREQFGRPIGSFQALKHRAADHKTAMITSSVLLNHAIEKHAQSGADLLLAAAAKGCACDTYSAVAADAVQMHGGIGFTWEHRAHLYLKRAKLDQQLFGGSEYCYGQVFSLLEDEVLAKRTREQDEQMVDTLIPPLAHRMDVEAFRQSFRAWLKANVPTDWKQRMCGATEEDYVTFSRQWFESLKSIGLTTPHWPKDWGGAELPFQNQIVVAEEVARADAPSLGLFIISLYHLPATLFEHGTSEQRERYLTGAKDRQEVWCQGFSEPNAGSDLASLRTYAEKQGDAYIVNGQKVWSTWGQFADYCLLLVRTDRAAKKKQLGISYFIMDMRSPGITVRPIKQITGESEFTEIFLDNVEIPASNLIGRENEGWSIAQSTLSAERGLLVFEVVERAVYAVRRDLLKAQGGWSKDIQFRREFGRCYAQLLAARLLIRAMLAESEEAGAANLASFIKLHWATLLQRYTELMVRAEGLAGQIQQPLILGGGLQTGASMADYLHSFAWTIPGGTNEVIRNIIAERVLSLPKG
jgi:alkylation response protein AidB-like acyl-CoA dehydrogenase